MAFIQTVTGAQKVPTGGQPTLRGGNSGELAVIEAHGYYQEPTYRGNVWAFSTAYAGLTLVGTTSVIGAVNWAPLVGLWNPSGSQVYLSIIKGYASLVSGTTTAGGIGWGYAPPTTLVTAAGTNGAINLATFVTGGSIARTYITTSPITGLPASGGMLAPFPVNSFAAAVGATTSSPAAVDEVAGAILVPPGGAIGISGTLGTSTIVQAGIVWEEIPL